MSITTPKVVESISFTPEGLGPWSFSKHKKLQKCPFQFYLDTILKVKPLETPPVSVQTECGKAVHRILELVVMGKSQEEAFKVTRKEFEELLPGDTWMDGHDIERGGPGRSEMSVSSFMDRLDKFSKDHSVKRFITELRIGVTRNWEPTGFFAEDVYYRGIVDLIIQLSNGDIVFIDHKNGPPSTMGVKNFQSQLDLYKVLFYKGIEPTQHAQSGVHFVQDGEVVMGTMTDPDTIRDKMVNRVEFELKGTIDKLLETGYFKHVMGSWCQWCNFKDPCKAGLLKPLEMDSKKYFPIKAIV
jgi:RecB family exonuclease